jgi:hypothetical protein
MKFTGSLRQSQDGPFTSVVHPPADGLVFASLARNTNVIICLWLK